MNKLEAIAREIPMKNSFRFGTLFDGVTVLSIVTEVISMTSRLPTGFMADRCRSSEFVDYFLRWSNQWYCWSACKRFRRIWNESIWATSKNSTRIIFFFVLSASKMLQNHRWSYLLKKTDDGQMPAVLLFFSLSLSLSLLYFSIFHIEKKRKQRQGVLQHDFTCEQEKKNHRQKYMQSCNTWNRMTSVTRLLSLIQTKNSWVYICVAGISNEDRKEVDDEHDLNMRQKKREENRIALPDSQEKQRKEKKTNRQTFTWSLSMLIECDQLIGSSCSDPTSE